MKFNKLIVCLLLFLSSTYLTASTKKRLCCISKKIDALASIISTKSDCGANIIHISQADIPYTITKPGRYCLMENVTVPAGANGITIDLDSVANSLVSIDLSGCSISGSDANGDSFALNGIVATSSIVGDVIPVGVTIKNGSIFGMVEHGIYIPHALIALSIDSISMISAGNGGGPNFGGIVVGDSSAPTINPTITNCKFEGVDAQFGIFLTNAIDYLIDTVDISIAVQDGLKILNSISSPFTTGIINSTFSSANGGAGFNISTVAGSCHFEYCIAAGNGGAGYDLTGNFFTLDNCHGESNAGSGMLLTGSSNIVTKSTTSGNGGSGFAINGSNNVITGCVAQVNRADGYLLIGSSNDNQINGNIATGCTAFGFNAQNLLSNRFYTNFANDNSAGNYSANITNVQVNPVPSDAINFTTNISN